MKNAFCKASLFATSTACALLCPSLLFAQEGTPPSISVSDLVQTGDIQSTLISKLGQWAVIGLSVGIAVVVVTFGWRFLKRFMRG